MREDFVFKNRNKHLDQLGFALQHFPKYVNLDLQMHGLDVVLLSVFLDGQARHHIEDMQFEEEAGSIGITHYEQKHGIVTSRDGIEVVNILLDLESHPLPPLPRELEATLPLFLPLHPNFGNRLNRIVRFSFSDKELLRRMVFAMRDELENEAPGYEMAATNLLQNFLIQCCREVLKTGTRPSELGSSGSNDQLEKVRQYIDNHHTESLTLDDLADQAGLQASYLCRKFRAYTGKTIFEYILDRRIQAAMFQLRNSRDKVFAIALDCGFNDLSHFNRTFKKRLGCSPTTYRKRFK